MQKIIILLLEILLNKFLYSVINRYIKQYNLYLCSYTQIFLILKKRQKNFDQNFKK